MHQDVDSKRDFHLQDPSTNVPSQPRKIYRYRLLQEASNYSGNREENRVENKQINKTSAFPILTAWNLQS